MAIEINAHNTVRGRPRTTGKHECARCQRHVGKIRIHWPEGPICGICFHQAMRRHGTCTVCGDQRLLPGQQADNSPICAPCANIPVLACHNCNQEGEHYRDGFCARCTLRCDLTELLLTKDTVDEVVMNRLIDILTTVDRPESVFAWLRAAPAKNLLRRLSSGATPLTHEGLDAEPPTRSVEHVRSLLEHHALLPERDHHLALFERWLTKKFDAIADAEIRQPVERFARWHHLARIRGNSKPGTLSRGPVHSAKQEITETLKFLTWLHSAHDRHLPACTQEDITQYLAEGPTTRTAIRTFFVWLHKTGQHRGLTVERRKAKTVPQLTQEERLAWIRELVAGTTATLPYRVAGLLLLLYAQPLVRIVELRVSDIVITPDGPALVLGTDPVPVPKPFARLLLEHLNARPNQRGANTGSDWLFPSTRAGRHLHANTVMDRLRDLGINLLGARNRAIRDLVSEVPAPVVAKLLGYSDQVTQLHASAAAVPMSRYAASRVEST